MGFKIVVVDDEAPIRFLFRDFLIRHGYHVVTAADYDEGWEVIRDSAPDLVFADIMLGEKTGLDLLRVLREAGVACPVVMITGYPNLETATEALQLGAFDYLVKPVHLDRLLKVTKNALEQYYLRRENEEIRANLEAIFASVREAIVTVDRDLKVIQFNDAAASLLRLDREKGVGAPLFTATDQCEALCLEAVQRTMDSGLPVVVERTQCRTLDGRVLNLNLTATPLIRHGEKEVAGGVLVVRDETRLATLEDAFGERLKFHRLVGKSAPMLAIYSLLEKLADAPTTVLITGESGTGKELVAEALHYQGRDGRKKPMVKVNCAALPDSLLESELFGHVKGAFTGAIANKVGRFELADGGTIFLDEIGDISPRMQLRLLRVIQEREFERVGESRSIKVNVRLVTATNQDLAQKVKEGSFREDLYYRLKVVVVPLPPLRERKADIPHLVAHFIERFNQSFDKSIAGVSPAAERLLMRHPWPGNVRELEHVMEHGFILCNASHIDVEHLPVDFVGAMHEVGSHQPRAEEDAAEIPQAQEVLATLENCRWNKTRAAKSLGINRRTLYRWMKRLGIADAPEGESTLS